MRTPLATECHRVQLGLYESSSLGLPTCRLLLIRSAVSFSRSVQLKSRSVSTYAVTVVRVLRSTRSTKSFKSFVQQNSESWLLWARDESRRTQSVSSQFPATRQGILVRGTKKRVEIISLPCLILVSCWLLLVFQHFLCSLNWNSKHFGHRLGLFVNW